jgi:hypothetical protein
MNLSKIAANGLAALIALLVIAIIVTYPRSDLRTEHQPVSYAEAQRECRGHAEPVISFEETGDGEFVSIDEYECPDGTRIPAMS